METGEDSSSHEAKYHHRNPLRCLTVWGSSRVGNTPTVAPLVGGGQLQTHSEVPLLNARKLPPNPAPTSRDPERLAGSSQAPCFLPFCTSFSVWLAPWGSKLENFITAHDCVFKTLSSEMKILTQPRKVFLWLRLSK